MKLVTERSLVCALDTALRCVLWTLRFGAVLAGVQELRWGNGVCPNVEVYYIAVTTVLYWRYSSKPASPHSHPNPLFLHPPNGVLANPICEQFS